MELVLQDFYEASKLSEEDVLCVYLVVSTTYYLLSPTQGSRLIGISRPDSDYDLKVVVKNSYTGEISIPASLSLPPSCLLVCICLLSHNPQALGTSITSLNLISTCILSRSFYLASTSTTFNCLCACICLRSLNGGKMSRGTLFFCA
jgi:hypothetical protein